MPGRAGPGAGGVAAAGADATGASDAAAGAAFAAFGAATAGVIEVASSAAIAPRLAQTIFVGVMSLEPCGGGETERFGTVIVFFGQDLTKVKPDGAHGRLPEDAEARRRAQGQVILDIVGLAILDC